MKLVRWEFQGLHMPMMEDEKGDLLCTSKSICNALGIDETTLRVIYSRHASEFDSNCVSNCNAIDFLRNNKVEFGHTYVRGDMRLWSEDDMLTFAFHSKSPQSLEFRKNLRRFIKQHAMRNYVSLEAFKVIQGRLDQMEHLIAMFTAQSNQSASMAGTVLSQHKKAKHLNLVH